MKEIKINTRDYLNVPGQIQTKKRELKQLCRPGELNSSTIGGLCHVPDTWLKFVLISSLSLDFGMLPTYRQFGTFALTCIAPDLLTIKPFSYEYMKE